MASPQSRPALVPSICLCLCLVVLVPTSAAAAAMDAAAVPTSQHNPGPMLGTIRIGCIVPEDQALGSAIKTAVRKAAEAAQGWLPGTMLEVLFANEGGDELHGIAATFQLLQEGVAAIVGPPSSSLTRNVADLLKNTRVPAVSYGASDPASVSSSSSEYILRTVHSGAAEVQTMAAIVDHYGWDRVIMLHMNSDLGYDDLLLLKSFLDEKDVDIEFVVPIEPGANYSSIVSTIAATRAYESTVYLALVTPDVAPSVFQAATGLGLMSLGYAWFVRSDALELLAQLGPSAAMATDGIMGTRVHLPPLTPHSTASLGFPPSTTGVPAAVRYAYDAALMIGHALRAVAAKLGATSSAAASLVYQPHALGSLPSAIADASGYNALSANAAGPGLLKALLGVSFNGSMGLVVLDKQRDRASPPIEILNIVLSRQLRTLGYWTSDGGIFQSLRAPTATRLQLKAALWPGDVTLVPKGWAARARPTLRIAVPDKTDFTQFVNLNNDTFSGFCVEVFKSAASLLPYKLDYQLAPYGVGNTSLSYTDMLRAVGAGEYDGAVGDITVTALRSSIIDYTTPFVSSSLSFAVLQQPQSSNGDWSFLSPFTMSMWFLFFGSTLFTGLVVWFLEHIQNDEIHHNDQLQYQLSNSMWYAWATVVFSQDIRIKTTLGRITIINWLFLVLIVTTSYTASLSTTFTVQNLGPSPPSIKAALSMKLPLGYHDGSFTHAYLNSIGIPDSKLVPLGTINEFSEAIQNGTVSGVLDESPYLDVFTSQYCAFISISEEISNFHWAFAFQKGSQVGKDISRAITELQSTGALQTLKNFWFLDSSNCPAQSQISSSSLSPADFWFPFTLYGCVLVLCVLIFAAQSSFKHCTANQDPPANCSPAADGDKERLIDPYRCLIPYLPNLSFRASAPQGIVQGKG